MRPTECYWKPIASYFDLDGIEGRFDNREAFRSFLDLFGFTDYMFRPIVMDMNKLLAGRIDFNKPKLGAMGFDRLPDSSFESLGYYSRAFRCPAGVVLANMTNRLDRQKMQAWCKSHGCRYVVCKPEFAFHNRGKDTLCLFMTDETYAKLAAPLTIVSEGENDVEHK